jgi:hypothetical protein
MIGRDLESQALERDAVVAADGAIVLLTQNIFELLQSCGDEGVALLGGSHHELTIEGRAIDFIEGSCCSAISVMPAAASSLTKRS